VNGSNPSVTFSLDIQLAPDLNDAPVPQILQCELESCLTALAQTLPEMSTQSLLRDICLRLCDEAESQALNRDYRDRNKPTNVLSFGVLAPESVFPASESAEPMGDVPEMPLGDLAICWPIVVREARQQHKTTTHHLCHLFTHGVLHLMGWDHESSAEALAMEKIERAALARLGIADPYLGNAVDS
jgi:probable rRNA maturation factor